ncbi:major facilitator superfamily protein [Nocardioides flavus (ex Wang et al. 2016)]|uniref:Major facilitator superfamily protein n=1 Tax=Nocardioides flavus (ex Wang et al. 2016) TaxID=2058780 RepID=A0ABQ3HPW2_9ACTN|nr:major facilitator superfamily protein [Nocardioides flavus (ex Wang et al. 2016)]
MTRPVPSAWRVVWWFGFVSLAADMVYEGARSVYGPLLATLGASAVVVGLVTGAGEAVALVLRLAFGPIADRTGRYWSLTILGYGLTAVCVPLLALAPRLGAAGIAFAATLILLERLGKAIRSPSKSALLAHVTSAVGRGRGFGVHKALDQVGALAGPLLVAGVVAAASVWTGMAVLAVPGAVAMLLLVTLRRRVPDPGVYDGSTPPSGPARATDERRGWWADVVGAGLPRDFFRYAVAASLTTGGLVTFGIIGYHLTVDGLLPVAAVPVVYAAAMAVEAVAALVVGTVYDRSGARVLLAVPVLVALVPALALGSALVAVLAGVAAWGIAQGVQDSTVKAVVADLVDAPRRATAYGVFAGVQGLFAIVGGVTAGWLYERSLPALVLVVALSQLLAVVLLADTFRRSAPRLPAG